MCSQSCTSITPVTHLNTLKRNLASLAFTPHFCHPAPTPSSLRQPQSSFCPCRVSSPDISYQWSHALDGLLWLACISWCDVFKVHSCHSMHQNFIPFLWPSSIPLCGISLTHLSADRAEGGFVFSAVVNDTNRNACVQVWHERMFSFLLCGNVGVELLGHADLHTFNTTLCQLPTDSKKLPGFRSSLYLAVSLVRCLGIPPVLSWRSSQMVVRVMLTTALEWLLLKDPFPRHFTHVTNNCVLTSGWSLSSSPCGSFHTDAWEIAVYQASSKTS